MRGRWRGGFRGDEEGKWINGEMGKTKIETGKRANSEKETIRAYSFSVLFLSTLARIIHERREGRKTCGESFLAT
jgi:hypothetical protein